MDDAGVVRVAVSVVVAISNLPTGQLTYFDSSYDFRLTNTGSGARAR